MMMVMIVIIIVIIMIMTRRYDTAEVALEKAKLLAAAVGCWEGGAASWDVDRWLSQ